MRSAVCDDDKFERALLCSEVRRAWEDAVITEYDNGPELYRHIQKGAYFDLVFLDILMDGENGIDTGKKIRRYCPAMSLVFVSSSREFGPEAFEVNALQYLVKPCDASQMAEVKRRYQRGRENKVLIHLGRQQTQEIPCGMITYIESVHNNLLIHLVTGAALKIRGSLHGFMEEVDDRFIRVNRGILVNMEAIEQMNSDSCQVAGMIFTLSRKERAANKRRYNNWLFRTAIGERQYSS